MSESSLHSPSSADIQLLVREGERLGGQAPKSQKFLPEGAKRGLGLSGIGQRCLGPILFFNFQPEK